jgi:hypothetical protein
MQDCAAIEHSHCNTTRAFRVDDRGDLAVRIDTRECRQVLFALAGVDWNQFVVQPHLLKE